MFVVQKRNSERALWKTCSHNGKKCRFDTIAQARTSLRMQKEETDPQKYPQRQFRIINTEADANKEVE